ncbi:hypothetical protein [Phyllobacterium leguminum]|uniref:Uncharacterized protein n=1 Tax=Phyllobacterium leguminum TaxID=314237 RepID=A0A318SXU5_9HYPH|nr:hypothetical protein [Phyllobacterium leguminum]PYE85146.1 hypothetical protein C7477_1404 [Phyllobacterium leguminum]
MHQERLTLENVQKALSFYFKFEVDVDKSLNIDYNMDGEEVVLGIVYCLEKFDCDDALFLKKFSYTLYFKQGVIHPLKTHIRRFLGLSYDKDLYREEVPLTTRDLYEFFKAAQKGLKSHRTNDDASHPDRP